MSKTSTAYTIRNKKTGQFLSAGGARNVKNLAAARFWATEAGARGWLKSAGHPSDSFHTRLYMDENRKDLQVIPVKLKAMV